LTYNVAANTSGSRTAVMTVAGQQVTITQSAATGAPAAPTNLRIVR
jgi:hypothetical protein